MSENRKFTARDTALEVLMQIERANAWSDSSLKRTIAKNGLEGREAALATRLAYGVVQNRTLLDYYITCYCVQKAHRLEPVIRNILRIGGYQILFMDKIPHRAAVMNMLPIPQGSTAEYLSVRYSHPRWLVERLLELLPAEEAEQFLQGDNDIVPTTIQTNLLKTDDESLLQELRQAGVDIERHGWLPHCFTVSGTGSLERLPAFAEGRFMVQDAAAHLVTVVAGPQKGDRVQDVCAAPGGKSFAAAIAMEGEGQILSCDIHPHKLKLIDSGAKRLGISCLRTMLADAREHHAAWDRAADVVIADVPCSGLGIIRKKPDIRYKNPEELAQLPIIQRGILENVCRYVRSGGVLVYSTCTILPEENEQVTEAFLQAHPEFERTAFTLPLPIGSCDGQLTLWPQRHGTDGFYICRMRRKD